MLYLESGKTKSTARSASEYFNILGNLLILPKLNDSDPEALFLSLSGLQTSAFSRSPLVRWCCRVCWPDEHNVIFRVSGLWSSYISGVESIQVVSRGLLPTFSYMEEDPVCLRFDGALYSLMFSIESGSFWETVWLGWTFGSNLKTPYLRILLLMSKIRKFKFLLKAC